MGELFKADDDVDEEMKGEIDNVLGLLDRLKEERKKDLMSTQDKQGDEDRAAFYPKKKEEAKVMDFSSDSPPFSSDPVPAQATPPRKKSVTVTVDMSQSEKKRKASRGSRGSIGRESRDSQDSRGSISCESSVVGGGEGEVFVDWPDSGGGRVVVAQKRKQDDMVAEIQEKAEVISKSARKGVEAVASTIARTHDLEEDPEAAEYLRKIRGKSLPISYKSEVRSRQDVHVDEEGDKRAEITKSEARIDLGSSPKTVTVKLNLDLQKSRISAAKGAGLKGRRKPTADHRHSWRLSNGDDLDEKFAEWERENMEQDAPDEPEEPSAAPLEEPVSPMACTAVAANVMEASPVEYPKHLTGLARRGSFDGLIPRTKPKPAKPGWKSKTYGGIALPAFDEAMKSGGSKILKKTSSDAMLTADIVKQAALDKLNRAAKEDKPEREPEKPAWLVEAETRRKLHDRRRHGTPKTKPEEPEKPAIPVHLRSTGTTLVDNDAKKEVVVVGEKTEIAFKLKPTGRRMDDEMNKEEPDKVEFAFKLRPTGIQLVTGDDDNEKDTTREAVIPVRLRPVGERGKPRRQEPQDEEPEIAVKLRLVRERLNAQEEQQKLEEHTRVPVKLKPLEKRHSFDEPKKVEVRSDTTTYATAPVKVQTRSEIHAVMLSQKSIESAHVVSPVPTRTMAESTPPLSPTSRPPTKASYKVTPLSVDERYFQERREFSPPMSPPSRGETSRKRSDSIPATAPRPYQVPQSPTAKPYSAPMSPPSSTKYRTPSSSASPEFRSPPTSPTSRVTVVAHQIDAPPAKQVPVSTSRPQRVPPVEVAPRAVPDRRAELDARPIWTARVDGPPPPRAESVPIARPVKVAQLEDMPSQAVPSDFDAPRPADSQPRKPSTEMSRPAKIRARHLSSERSKSVTVTAREVPYIEPSKRASAEYPQFELTMPPPVPAYPKMRVEKVGNGHLKHAATSTVVTARHIPASEQQTLIRKEPHDRAAQAVDFTYKPSTSGEVLPNWKQELLEKKRRSSREELDTQSPGPAWRRLDPMATEPKVLPDTEPQWMKDLAVKRRKGQLRRFSAEIQSAEEQFQPPPSHRQEEETDGPTQVVPSFMREFEKKRRHKGPGPQMTQVHDGPEWPVQRRVNQGSSGPGPVYRRPGSSSQSYV